MRDSRHRNRGGSLAGVLFGLVFFGIGVGFFFFLTFPGLSLWYQAQGWEAAEARVIEADLDVSRSDDSTSYRAVGRYRYRYADQAFESQRIGLFDGADGIGSWQQDTARRLERAKGSGQSVRVWVNPQDPRQALFEREMRWGHLGLQSIFSVLFGGFGLAAMLGSLRRKREADEPRPQGVTVGDAGAMLGVGSDAERSASAGPGDPSPAADRRSEIPGPAADGAPPPIPEGRLQIRRQLAELEFYHPYGRNLGVGSGLLLFGAVFFGAGWFMGLQGAPSVMALIFGAIGALVMLIGLYLPLNSLRVRVGPGGVEVRRRVLGLGGVRQVRPGEVRRVAKKVSSQTSQGNKTTVYYKVGAETAQGQTLTVAEGLDSAAAADYVGDLARQALGGVAGPDEGAAAARPEIPPLVRALLDRSNPAHKKLKRVMNLIVFALIVAFFWGPISAFLLK